MKKDNPQKIFASHIPDKRFVSRTYKELLLQLNNKKTKSQLKMILIDKELE